MISASSSTLRAARKLIVEPLVCLEHHRTWTASLSQLQQRSYHKGGPATEQQPRQPPHSVPTAPRLGPRTKRSSSNSQIKTKTPGGNPERPKRLLEPYVLSRRLTALASRGQLNDAVVMLQNSPSDATNVKTWNTLLLHCMMEKRFKLGYKLFTDMKRRGLVPNVRTYKVLLSGLSRIGNWENYGLQFKNSQALWESFLRHIEDLKKINPEHKDIEPSPAAFYLMILAANKEYNVMFDVLNALDEEGPFSPTEFIYTRFFNAITYRPQLTPGDKEKVAYRNASDAKLVWKDLTKRAVKDPKLMSNRNIQYFLKAVMEGRPVDQLYEALGTRGVQKSLD